MKCIKNKNNGNILRVEDNVAYNMVGSTWEYVSKSVWRESQGLKTEKPVVTESTETTPVEKKKKNSKKVVN